MRIPPNSFVLFSVTSQILTRTIDVGWAGGLSESELIVCKMNVFHVPDTMFRCKNECFSCSGYHFGCKMNVFHVPDTTFFRFF